jgi:hypothetical protein
MINAPQNTATTDATAEPCFVAGRWESGSHLDVFSLAVPSADTKPQISITYRKEFPEIKKK